MKASVYQDPGQEVREMVPNPDRAFEDVVT